MTKIIKMSSIPKYGKEMKEKEFSHLRKGSVFLNQGSFGVIPTKIKKLLQKYRDELDEHPDDWFRRTFFDRWVEARNVVADFVNCNHDDLVFVQNDTSGVNTILKSLRLKPTEAILATNHTHRACKNTCIHCASINDALLRVMKIEIPIRSEDDVVQAYDEYLTNHPEIKIAIIDHITCASALVLPVKKLVRVCRKHNVLSLIDGAHAPGQIELDLKDIDADFYTGTMYKWCFTPQSCAILYVRKEHQSWVHPLVTSHFYKFSMTEEFFKQGTLDNTAYLVVPDAIQFYKDIGGIEAVTNRNSALLDQATDLMVLSWGTEKLPVPKSMEAPCMRLVRLPDIPGYTLTEEELKQERTHPYEYRLMDKLYNEYDVQVNVFVLDSGTYIRLSAHVYNDIEDYRLCIKRINELR